MCALASSSPQNTVRDEFKDENILRQSIYAISERAQELRRALNCDAPENTEEAAQ